jgi:circadian clock protein KaiC
VDIWSPYRLGRLGIPLNSIIGDLTNTAGNQPTAASLGLPQASTGNRRLDEIIDGGSHAVTPMLVRDAGMIRSGKTMLAIEFLLRGATERGEPDVVIRNIFEE